MPNTKSLRGVWYRFAQLVPMAVSAAVFFGFGMSAVYNDAGHFDFTRTMLLAATGEPAHKIFLVLITFACASCVLSPLTFVAVAAAARRACIKPVVNGEPFKHDVGGFFLSMVLRSPSVGTVAGW